MPPHSTWVEETTMSVPWKAPGFTSVTPYLAVRDAAGAVRFYERAFGAELTMKLTLPDGKYAHAEIHIGDAVLMLSEENPQWGNRSPQALGGSPVQFMVYVPDADAAYARAIEAGCTPVRPVEDQFYGDRSGTVSDPYGFQWTLATHKEEISEAEGQRRMAALFSQG
jgi:PhnB protein